jgi:hypothetical protein
VVSYIGFETQEIRVENRSTVDLEMRAASGEMQQVVVVGYGTQRKATYDGFCGLGDKVHRNFQVNLL